MTVSIIVQMLCQIPKISVSGTLEIQTFSENKLPDSPTMLDTLQQELIP